MAICSETGRGDFIPSFEATPASVVSLSWLISSVQERRTVPAHNSSEIKFHVGPHVLAGQGGEELREWDPNRINHFCSDRSHKNPSKVGS